MNGTLAVRRTALLWLTAMLTLVVLAGCGKDKKDEKAKAPIGGTTTVAEKKSLLGDSATAGEGEAYEPTGEIVSDLGFRPEVDGLPFENYGNDVQPENMTPFEVEELFGEQVCVSGSGEECRLFPAAQRWMEQQNASMDGGHCMGFSVTTLRMYQETVDVNDFGADTPIGLEIQGNTDLQSEIAQNFVYQGLPGVQESTVMGAPSEILEALQEALDDGEETYTIGIYMADGTGGHAITPFAIEDKGDDQYAILVYDNNFPGLTRAIEVNTVDETWSYVGGINPQNLGEVYEGNDETQSMSLLPTSPGEELQPCPFCGGLEAANLEEGAEEDEEGGELGTTLAADKRYSEITLRGDVDNHPHLVLTDEEGRQSGIVDGEVLREIPGVKLIQPFGVQNWEASPEPRFQVPEGKDIAITVDGSDLERKAKAHIDLVGNGLVISVEEIEIAPGQEDNVYVSGGGHGLYYESNGKAEFTPELYAGLEDEDAAYTFAAAATGLNPGSTIGLLVDQEEGTVLLDADGAKGQIDGKGFYALAVSKVTEDEELTWLDDLELSTTKKEGAYFNFRETPAAGKPLTLEIGPEDGPFRKELAQFDAG